MLTAAEGRAQRKELMARIAREHKKAARAKLRELRAQLREARAAHRTAIANARAWCMAHRIEARTRIKQRRNRLRLELRSVAGEERAAARAACDRERAAASEALTKRERARASLEAERKYRRELKRIERANKTRKREFVQRSAREKRAESDDEVRANIPPELVPAFERVKRGIKATPRQSRTEAFLHYVHENPRIALEALEDRTEAAIAELEARERAGRRTVRRVAPRRELEAFAATGEVPF